MTISTFKYRFIAVGRILILLTLIFNCHHLFPQATFQKTLGTENNEKGAGAIELSNGDLLLVMESEAISKTTKTPYDTDIDIVITKINPQGNIISALKYPLPGNQNPSGFIETKDGGFLVVGDELSGNTKEVFLMKLNQNLAVEWTKKFTHPNRMWHHLLREDPVGNIYLGIDCFRNNGIYPDDILLKLDASGNVLWKKTWGIGNNDHIYDIHFSGDGKIYIALSIWFPSAQIVIICLNENGQNIWQKSLFQDYNYYPRSFIDIGNGETILIGSAHYPSQTFVIKFDQNFNISWYKRIATSQGELSAKAGVFINNKVYIIANNSINNGDIAMIRLDVSGNIDWIKSYGGDAIEETPLLSNSCIYGSESGIYLTGTTNSFGAGQNDVYLIKTDLNGVSGCNEMDLVPVISSMQYSPEDVDISNNFDITINSVSISAQAVEDFIITTLCSLGIQADFTSNIQIACVNEVINFIDLSQINPTSWQWTFEGGNPPTSVKQNPENIQYSNPGIYDVSLIVSDGETQDTIIKEGFIQILPSPSINLGSDTSLCSGEMLILHPGSGFQNYLWQDGSTDSTFTATQGGTYWVDVTDEYGCTGRDTINLTFLSVPDVSFGNDTLVCFNEFLQLDAGEGYENYLWQDGSGGQTYLVTQPGNYWVEVANECGFGSDTISVGFTEYFDVWLGNDTSFCYGQSVLLDAGAGYSSYFWNNGSTSQSIIVATTGNYWVEVNDSLDCTATDSIYIEAFMDFNISIGEDTMKICEGDYTFLNGPEGYESYLWQDGSTYPTLLADTAGIYWLEVTDENGCAARDSTILVVNIIPADLLGNDTVICPDSELTLHAKSGFQSYEWQDGSSGSTFVTDHAGEFQVTVFDEIGCSGTDNILISDFIEPGLNLAREEWICHGDSLLLDAGEGYLSYLWQDGSIEPEYLATDEGLYKVQIETICGFYADSVEVYFYEGNLDLGRDTILCDGEQLLLYPGTGYSSYYWSNGSTDSILIVGEKGEYWLEAFDGFCYISDSIAVDACANIWIPNVFTPNGDESNETFYAKAENPAGITQFKLTIFNRWGRIVYEINDIDDNWDGRLNGNECSAGAYFWVCDYQAIDKYGSPKNHSKQGSITLIR